MADFGLLRLGQAGGYSIYVLFILLLAYLLNQLDRYMLAITNPTMARDIGYGGEACLEKLNLPDSAFSGVHCTNATTEERCATF